MSVNILIDAYLKYKLPARSTVRGKKTRTSKCEQSDEKKGGQEKGVNV